MACPIFALAIFRTVNSLMYENDSFRTHSWLQAGTAENSVTGDASQKWPTHPVLLAIRSTEVYLSEGAFDRCGTMVTCAIEDEKWTTTNTNFG